MARVEKGSEDSEYRDFKRTVTITEVENGNA